MLALDDSMAARKFALFLGLAIGVSGLDLPPAFLKELTDAKNKAKQNPPNCDSTFEQQEQTANAVKEDLVAAGWEVTDGTMIFTSGHAFGNNPESVYG